MSQPLGDEAVFSRLAVCIRDDWVFMLAGNLDSYVISLSYLVKPQACAKKPPGLRAAVWEENENSIT
jgi:hypothetical protein